MNYHWTNSELNNFIEYEKLGNKFALCPPEDISEEMRIQYFLLEGKLLTMNKYIVCFLGLSEDIKRLKAISAKNNQKAVIAHVYYDKSIVY